MPSAAHDIVAELTEDDIAARLATLVEGGDLTIGDEPPVGTFTAKPAPYRYLRPWEEAADEYVQFSRDRGRRVYTGIEDFDGAMRGLAPKELLLVIGHAHQGKTVFATQMLFHNRERRIALFTPDETRVLVLVKLASIIHGMSAEDIEWALADNDPEVEQMLRDVARQHFPNMAVFDEITDLVVMRKALDECEAWWGDKADLVVIDYADLVTGCGEDTASKLNAIKSFGKQRDVPLVLLHQTSRSAGAGGQKLGISSGGFGGEQQATFMVGVRRKKSQYQALLDELNAKLNTAMKGHDAIQDAIADAEYELKRHRDTVTFSLVKNKRPPSRLIDDMDFILDSRNGRVRPFDGAAPYSPAAMQRTIEGGEEPF